MDGSRVKSTPVALSFPRFPKTMVTIVTAVPRARSGVMRYCFLYSIARFPFQLLKTATIASSSCFAGSWGSGFPSLRRRSL